jgi:hypothetical protein
MISLHLDLSQAFTLALLCAWAYVAAGVGVEVFKLWRQW